MPEYGRRLVLKDGTIIENGEAGYANGFLWCYITGTTIAEVAGVFMDPEKTDRIEFQYGEKSDVYEHHTEVRYLSNDGDRVSVCLTVPEE